MLFLLCKNKAKLFRDVLKCFLVFLFLILPVFLGVKINTAQATVAWYDQNWGYRTKITIDHTKVGSATENELNFPVLVSLSGLSNINVGGSDIRFTSSDGVTNLSREIEYYATSTGTLIS